MKRYLSLHQAHLILIYVVPPRHVFNNDQEMDCRVAPAS